MKKNISVAIIIPVHKRNGELHNLLNSLNNLEYKYFQILIVNNSNFDFEFLKESTNNLKIFNMGMNYGATTGFNAGIKHILNENKYKYLWLLDSDITVEQGSLNKLLKVIESDESIGIVGPKIINSEDTDLVVEVGGNIDLNTGNIQPIDCNNINSDDKKINDVDYLGSGVSLIRTEAIKKVGLMNESYYFIWDDIDYCLAFKKAGYRVVTVSDSIVYHPAFTEKRDQRISVYYGIRNMLLLVSMHGSFVNIIRFNFDVLRKNLKNIYYALINNNFSFETYRYFAFKDFIFNKFGKGTSELKEKPKPQIRRQVSLNLNGNEKILIFSNATSKIIKMLFNELKDKNPDIKISILCEENRKNIFRNYEFQEIVTINDNNNFLLAYFKLFFKLKNGNYDFAVNPTLNLELPFQHALKKIFIWDKEQNSFYLSNNNFYSLWKPVLAIILSEISAIFFLPLLLLISFGRRVIK